MLFALFDRSTRIPIWRRSLRRKGPSFNMIIPVFVFYSNMICLSSYAKQIICINKMGDLLLINAMQFNSLVPLIGF